MLVAGNDSHEYTLGKMCSRAFESLGCETLFIDIKPKTLPVLKWKIGTSRIQNELRRICEENSIDLLFIIKGSIIETETIEKIRQTGTHVCNWNPDNPFQARSEDRKFQTYLNALPAYDDVFIWTDELFSQLREFGCTSVHELPFAYDPRFHRPVTSSPEYQSDVVFVGSWSKKREDVLSDLLKLDIDLKIFGNNWRRRCFAPSIQSCYMGSAVYGTEYSKVHCSSKIGLNIVADHNLEAYNMRTFEIPATGTFMLTTKTEKQEKLLQQGKGAEFFSSTEDLRNKVRLYLSEGDQRQKIANNGHCMIKEHTYKQRMRKVLDISL